MNKQIEVSKEVYNELKLHYSIMKGILQAEEKGDFSLSDYVGILLGVGTNVFLNEANYVSFITHYASQQKYSEDRKARVMQTLNEYLTNLKEAKNE